MVNPYELPDPFAEADQPPMPAEPMAAPPVSAPMAAPEQESGGSNFMRLFALGAALGMGPRRGGTGILQGLQVADAEKKRSRDEQAMRVQQQQAMQVRQQQAEAQRINAERQAAAAKMSYIQEVRKAVSTAKTPEEYEGILRMYEQFAPQIVGESFRPNSLRTVAPFTAPSAVPAMRSALDAFLKNPSNKDMIASGEFLNASLMVDRYGDGHPVPVPIKDIVQQTGGSGLATDDKGTPIKPKKGEPEDSKLSPNAQSLLVDFYAKWHADHPGVEMPPDVRVNLKKKALREAAAADDKPTAGERLWVVRNGKILRVNDAQVRPGDVPYTPKTADEGPSNYMQERNVRNLQSVEELLQKVSGWTTGAGSLLANLPATEARNFAAELDTLKANIGFGELTAMREASKTGGALGQVSDREIKLLTSTLGALDPGQSPENFRRQLIKVRDSIKRWEAAAESAQGAGNRIGRFKVQVIQ